MLTDDEVDTTIGPTEVGKLVVVVDGRSLVIELSKR
jgi:hypothetical protein